MYNFLFLIAQSVPSGDFAANVSLYNVYVIASSTIAVFLAIMKAVEYFIKKDENDTNNKFHLNQLSVQSEACKYDHKQVIGTLERLEDRQEQHSLILNNITSTLKDITYVLKELKEDGHEVNHKRKSSSS